MKPGEALDIESQIFSDWIIGHYQEKNVRYVITYGNDYIIFSWQDSDLSNPDLSNTAPISSPISCKIINNY